MKFPVSDQSVRSSRSGTCTGYTVEARHNYMQPLVLGDQVFTKEWREVDFAKISSASLIGAPWPRYADHLKMAHLLSYEQAQCLRWQFLAIADATDNSGGGICLETRLVCHDLKHSYEATPREYIDPQDRRGNIPSDMTATDEQ